MGERMTQRRAGGSFAILVVLCWPGLAVADTPLTTIRIASGLSFPVFVTHAPGDFKRLFIVEQRGKIKIRKNGAVMPTPFLDVDPISSSTNERGLLGLAFHPDYPNNGRFFVFYTDNVGTIVVARYVVSGDPDVADPQGTVVLTIPHPLTNHNGGWIGFGLDGFLRIAVGDGGWTQISNPDPSNNAQTTTSSLLGKILRIDVDGDDFPGDANRNYAIPPDNPFIGITGDDEIWAYGLRNPWRCAFDSLSGDFYIGDVGHSDWEEINFEPAASGGGRNYGWKCMEGTHCSGYGGCSCDDESLVPPIHEYEHAISGVAYAVTGGEVYRGCAIPDLTGAYFFADYYRETIWSLLDPEGTPSITNRTMELVPAIGNIDAISSFGVDAAREVYVCDHQGGEVFKIVPDVAMAIADSDPPAGAIDARRPIDPDTGDPLGWSSVSLTFTQSVACLTELDFFTIQQGGTGSPPLVAAVTQTAPDQVDITLAAPLKVRARSTLTYETGGVSVQWGVLPGDVDANGMTEVADVTLLAGILAGSGTVGPIWSVDIDRSTLITPADLLDAVDLLVGAGFYDAFLGATLP